MRGPSPGAGAAIPAHLRTPAFSSRSQREGTGLAAGAPVSLVGAGTGFVARTGAGVTPRVAAGTGEPQGESALPGGGLGTGAGEQDDIPVGAGAGVAGPLPLGAAAAIGADLSTVGGALGTAEGEAVGAGAPATVAGVPVLSVVTVLAVGAALVAACPPPAAVAVPEHPVSARPAATPSAATPNTGTPSTRTPATGPTDFRGVLSLIRTCILLGIAGDAESSAPGNTSRPAKSCARGTATFPPFRPY